MPISPQQIRETRFKLAKRGYDAAEVETFLEDAASALEAAQNDATAMEARARAAVARLQELSQAEPRASVDESETISRTLLLAQRTADATIADAQAEAERVLAAAREEAAATIAAASEEAAGLLEEARLEARREGESERVQVAGEVQALLARRDFLESDVDHLEQYLVAQRERISEAVSELSELVERVPSGLGDMRRPLLSAAADDGAEAETTDVADAVEGGADDETDEGEAGRDEPAVSSAGDATPSSA